MTEEPQRFTLRPLRYIEPGSDSPWKEVFGTQSDGTHRPQYYSQLELPKILEQIAKDGKTWFPPELAILRAQKGLWTFTYKGEQIDVSSQEILRGIKVLQEVIRARALYSLSLETFHSAGIKSAAFAQFLLETALSASAQVSSIQVLSATLPHAETVDAQTSVYYVALYFIFRSSEGKALARVSLKLYTTLNASGLVASSTLFEHKKGINAQASGSSLCKLRLKRLLASSASALGLLGLKLDTGASSSAEVLCSKQLHAFNPHSSGASCLSQIYLDYIGYGAGFYNYGLYGV